MSLCKVFGVMKKDDLINKDVEVLMPRIFATSHKDLLQASIQKNGD